MVSKVYVSNKIQKNCTTRINLDLILENIILEDLIITRFPEQKDKA